MDVDEGTAYARDRLGMTVQVVMRAAPSGDPRGLTAWQLLTEGGYFYLVDGTAGCELVRTPKLTQALRKYRELHPEPVGPAGPGHVTFACTRCGQGVTAAATTMLARDQLCRRCRRRRAERRYREKRSDRAR